MYLSKVNTRKDQLVKKENQLKLKTIKKENKLKIIKKKKTKYNRKNQLKICFRFKKNRNIKVVANQIQSQNLNLNL